jgi:hypothetical protein
MKLICCAGTDAERFNRTRDHRRVNCWQCGHPFCVDARDVRAEAEHRPTVREPHQGKARRWFCSNDCRGAYRKAESAAETERLKAAAARGGGEIATEPGETLF